MVDCTKYFMPDARKELEALALEVTDFVSARQLTPPLSASELDLLVQSFEVASTLALRYQGLAKVLISNDVWKPVVATIPFSRRTLLLPPCLKSSQKCPAEYDELGLICEQCGECVIGDIQEIAEELGYAVLVAEGSSIVSKLIEDGMVDAVIGVSCLEALEKAWPDMTNNAIPGIAIPLMMVGCQDTKVNLGFLKEALALKSDHDSYKMLQLRKWRDEVDSWFKPEKLLTVLNVGSTESEIIAVDWLGTGGKRWRPFLVSAVYKSLVDDKDQDENLLMTAAISVECFHKASLIHDDIEDDDDLRYGVPALHKKVGMPVALNTGDLLLGDGYKLIDQIEDENLRNRLFRVAVEGHRNLCLGQGEELIWTARKQPLSIDQVIEIFALKTAPAFEVALRFGAECADAPPQVMEVIREFSRNLGIAYQILDDIDDFKDSAEQTEFPPQHPSLLAAIAYDQTENKALFEQWFRGESHAEELVREAMVELEVEKAAETMLAEYREKALQSLQGLQKTSLKSVLFRILNKIFS